MNGSLLAAFREKPKDQIQCLMMDSQVQDQSIRKSDNLVFNWKLVPEKDQNGVSRLKKNLSRGN